MKAKKTPKSKRIHYRITHPRAGTNEVFDSWLVLSETAWDIAELAIKKEMQNEYFARIEKLSDEIVESAVEVTDDSE